MDMAEEVYNSLLSITAEEYRLPWVDSIFLPGKECFNAYQTMLDAYQRLLLRLNQQEDDPDLEVMVNSLLDYSRAAGLKMFEYGMIFQNTKDVL